MGLEALRPFVGLWEIEVDLPGAGDVRGRLDFELMGGILVERATIPVPEAPDSCCVVLERDGGGYLQHYFDSRGVARLYEMNFDGRTWTLLRTKADFTPLEFHQRYIGSFDDSGTTISGEWQTSADGTEWARDFGITYRRVTG